MKLNKILSVLVIVMFTALLISCSSEDVADETVDDIEVSEDTEMSEEESDEEIAVEETEEVVINTNPTTKTVTLEDSAFNPVDVDISVGDTVEWVNSDDQEHSITFENGDFDEQIGVDSSVKYTFTESGEYRYFSVFVPEMQGNVFVS